MSRFEESKSEIQRLIKEEYDIVGKAGENDIQKDVRDIYIDTATEEILASYNKKYGVDIQQELRAYLEPTTMEKVRSSIEGKDINRIKKEEQKEISRTISSVGDDGIGVDATARKEIERKVEEQKKDGKEQSEVNLRAEVLKAMYKSVLEEYYNLKLDLQEGQNGQLSTGDISVGDKMSTKLVLYERYLKNIDKSYKGISKTEVVRDDKDVKSFEEKLAFRSGRNEEAVLEKNEENLRRVQELYRERDNIAEDITYLSTIASNMPADKFKTQMDELQRRYKETSARIYNINPNPLELQKSIEERAKEEQFRTKQVGESYERKHDAYLGSKVSSKEKENDIALEENVEKTNEQVEVSDVNTDKSAELILEQYYEAEERGNYGKAEEMLQSLETMADIKYEDVNATRTDKEEEKNPEELREQNEKKGNLLNDPRLEATNDEKEIAKIEADRNRRQRRVKAVEEKLNVKRKATDSREFEYTRNMDNRRGF